MSAIQCPKISKQQLSQILNATVYDPYNLSINDIATAVFTHRDPDNSEINMAFAGIFPKLDQDLTNISGNIAKIEFREDAKTKAGVRYKLFFAYKLGHEDDDTMGYRIAVYFDGNDVRAVYAGMLISITDRIANATTGIEHVYADALTNTTVDRIQADMKTRLATVIDKIDGMTIETAGYRRNEDGSYDFPKY